jgi:hypothetical protein
VINSKIELYAALAREYRYTPEQIANMTPLQQMVLTGQVESEKLTFATLDDYLKWNHDRG